MDLARYFKAAFINRWNLLFFLSGVVFSFLTTQPDAVLPLVIAGELGYLGLLGTRPRFQEAVDAQAAKAARVAGSVTSQQMLARITATLPKELLSRFDALRSQCLELRQIAQELKDPGKLNVDQSLDSYQISGLDRLLWIHLRLLYTQFALARFLQKTKAEQIRQEVAGLEERLKSVSTDANDVQAQRVRKALEDNLETTRTRLTNLAKARDNYELVKLEIDRLESKIRSLSEMAVNRQEPEFISGQVDQVASSMLDTEKTMNELQFATGLEMLDEQPPELLQAVKTK